MSETKTQRTDIRRQKTKQKSDIEAAGCHLPESDSRLPAVFFISPGGSVLEYARE